MFRFSWLQLIFFSVYALLIIYHSSVSKNMYMHIHDGLFCVNMCIYNAKYLRNFRRFLRRSRNNVHLCSSNCFFKNAGESPFALELNICFVSHGYSIFLSLFIPYLFIYFGDLTLYTEMFSLLKFQLWIRWYMVI